MNILKPIVSGNLWPLCEEDVLSEQFLGSKTLLQLQEENAPDGVEVTFYANAWVDPVDWQTLSKTRNSVKLVTENNELLAFIGDPDKSEIVMASSKSRLILYPWDLIYIHEQVVSEINESDISGDVSPAAHIEGNLIVGVGTRVLPGVYIEGNVVIGKNCKVGPNCYIRGNTTIGDHCHIGQSVEVKNSMIGTGSAVGHLSYVGDSILGKNVNFGAGTITSNFRHDGANHRSMTAEGLIDTGREKFGAIVGDNVHTGIHTSIYPGRKLGTNTSTRPGEVVQKDLM